MTAASEYGCLALLAIGECDSEWCKRQEIIERFAIPAAFLEQILRKLTAAGFVASRRGADGGFRLSRAASEIVIADVVRAMDGPLAPVRSVSTNFYQPSPVEASVAFHALFRRVRDAIAAILEETTLEDILSYESNVRERNARRTSAGRGRRRVARPAPRRS
ncbi:MAG TPA: Rrf2 family transcriptional regulator [Thermoanaerobaculia bacterium]|nr:Rrf2 family transcriptional regulator [Thermoanaerobaculia bacterium]